MFTTGYFLNIRRGFLFIDNLFLYIVTISVPATIVIFHVIFSVIIQNLDIALELERYLLMILYDLH